MKGTTKQMQAKSKNSNSLTVYYEGELIPIVRDLNERYSVTAVWVRAAILGFSRMERAEQSDLVQEINKMKATVTPDDSGIMETPRDVLTRVDAAAASQARSGESVAKQHPEKTRQR